jgi:Mechanosensitive ion channel, conserved TM helix
MWEQVQGVLKQSGARVALGIVNFLPDLLAFILILLLAAVLAWVLRALLRRALSKVDFDQWLVRWSLSEPAEWSPSRSPTLLVAGLAYWTVILSGLLIGLSALNTPFASQFTMGLLAVLYRLLIALLILAVGLVIARFLARSVLITAVNMQLQTARLLSLGVKWLVIVFVGAMTLQHLGIGGGMVPLAFGILFGGIVLALALAVGLGSKDLVSRSWERQQARKSEDQAEEQLDHL